MTKATGKATYVCAETKASDGTWYHTIHDRDNVELGGWRPANHQSHESDHPLTAIESRVRPVQDERKGQGQ